MNFSVKICGLSTPETLEAALASGADMVGFVFFPKSPRHISFETARALGQLADKRALKVALSVNADNSLLETIIENLRPDMLQLHGDETPERVAQIRTRFGLPVIKALGILGAADLDAARVYESVADWLLFDAKPSPDARHPGGNGIPFDWNVLAGRSFARPVLLSGGLDPGNVAEAVRIAAPDGVDVSSGVERAPGVKDIDKIAAFVTQARMAALANAKAVPARSKNP